MVAHKKTHHSSFSLHLFFNNTAEIGEGERWCFNILLLIVLTLQGLCYKSQTMGFEHAVSCQGKDLRLWWRCYICWPMHKEWTPTASKQYNMQFNNFYTLQSLLRTCFISISRLVELKKEKEKKGVGKRKRKAMKWVRDDSCLTLQWKDNRPVTNLSSINTANEFVHIERRTLQQYHEGSQGCYLWHRLPIPTVLAQHTSQKLLSCGIQKH